MRLKAITIISIIILSLLPVYMLYKYLEKVVRPRESLQRFFSWLLAMMVAIFAYTFLVVLIIKLVFPRA